MTANKHTKSKKREMSHPLKARTGIEGFDEITHGGLPRGRTTLLEGGPGSGKTLMALQTLVNGARNDHEAGIFVAFEETSQRITANAAQFGWDLGALQKNKLFFLDAQPTPDLIQSGNFDLGGMLAMLEVKVQEVKAKRIVLDAIDIALSLLNDPVARRRELYQLHDWLLAHNLTAIITSKATLNEDDGGAHPQMALLQFMVDCGVILGHKMIGGVSQRNVRVVKYRGSAFEENESPFVIGNEGLEIAGAHYTGESRVVVSNERVSSGVARLDTMLGGGYYRCSSVLITGFPGTAKTTLSGAFAEAACERGERTLYVSFDSDANEVIRNLASVNIKLRRFVKNGLLLTKSARTITGSAEIHLMRIRNLSRQYHVRCLVIDPLSALANAGNEETAMSVAERLIDWAKLAGITLVCTSLLEQAGSQAEGTPIQVSTIADTWIHLNYLVHAGERNRGLSIVKSRGTSHSNQVRELILSDAGVTLADAYTAGGEVLMGTLRWEKERAARFARIENEAASKQKQAKILTDEALLEVQLKAVQLELEVKRAEKRALTRMGTDRSVDLADGRTHIRELRGVDK
jgi:circadian clock protein KaiC